MQSNGSVIDTANTAWQTSPGLELPIDWSALSQAVGVDNLPGSMPFLDFNQTRSWDVLDYRPELSGIQGGSEVDQSGADATLSRGLLGEGSAADVVSSLFDGDVWQPFE